MMFRKTLPYSSEDVIKSRNESRDDDEEEDDTDRLDVVGFDDNSPSSPGTKYRLGCLVRFQSYEF